MKKTSLYKLNLQEWYIERTVYLFAGIFILVSIILSILIHKNFLYLTALVGSMLINFSLTGYCPLAILLKKIGLVGKIEN